VHHEVKLPKRQDAGDYVKSDLALRHIPTPF
jgi:hypothetical protein